MSRVDLSRVLAWWRRVGLRAGSWAAQRHPRLWRAVIAPAVIALGRISADALGVEAGSLTYGAFLSLPPLLILLLSLAGRVLRNDPGATKKILDAAARAIPGLEQMLGSAITLKTAQQLGLGIVGIVAVVWTASGFAARARHAFGFVFRTERTGLVFGRVSAAVVGTPIVLLLVALTALGGVAAGVRVFGSIPWITDLLATSVLTLVTFAFILLCFRLLTPGHGPSMREHVPGSILFSLGWLVIQLIGAEYVAQVVARSTALYGAIGAVFGILAFFYLTMWWLLFCAEFTQALREGRPVPLDG